MNRSKSWLSYVPPVLLAASLAGVYFLTIAPGLTWVNGGSDGGDLVTAAATGGIAHPTGYPLYLLLARLFQLLPVGSLAFRTNLMSAIMTALAAVLVYVIVTRSLMTSEAIRFWPAGLAAGYAFGLAPLIWSQAVITEVYALQSCLVLVILYLYIQPVQTSIPAQKRQDRWRGLWLGLAMGNHLTTLLLIPIALWVGSFRSRDESHVISTSRFDLFRNWRLDGHSLRRQLAWMGVGLSIYLLLPLWALAHPSINWGNPSTPGRLWWLVSGQLYQSYYLQTSLVAIWEHLQVWAALLLMQFGMPGLVLGLTGLIVFGAPSRLVILTSWMAAASLGFGLIYGSTDYYIYLIPMFISFTIWIGLAIMGLVQQLSPRFSKWGWGLGILLIVYFTGRSVFQISHVDASRDLRAESFGGKFYPSPLKTR